MTQNTKEYQRKWYKNSDKKHKQEYEKKYYSNPANRLRRSERQKLSYLKNRKQRLEASKQYQATPEAKRLRNKWLAPWRKVNSKRLLDIVLDHYGRQCACTGCHFHTNPIDCVFLTIDHKNNDGYKSRRAGMGLYYWIIRNNFPADLQTLCWNCNLGKNRNGGVCPHLIQT